MTERIGTKGTLPAFHPVMSIPAAVPVAAAGNEQLTEPCSNKQGSVGNRPDHLKSTAVP